MSDSDTITLDVADVDEANRLIGRIHYYHEVKQCGLVDRERINQAILIMAHENPELLKEILDEEPYV